MWKYWGCLMGVVGRANELDMTKLRCIYRSETDNKHFKGASKKKIWGKIADLEFGSTCRGAF